MPGHLLNLFTAVRAQDQRVLIGDDDAAVQLTLVSVDAEMLTHELEEIAAVALRAQPHDPRPIFLCCQ